MRERERMRESEMVERVKVGGNLHDAKRKMNLNGIFYKSSYTILKIIILVS